MSDSRIPLVDGYIDIHERLVVRPNLREHLSPNEARLVEFLSSHPGEYFTAEHLIQDVWGYKSVASAQAVKVAVHRLRRKIEPQPDTPTVLVTLPGSGIAWKGPPSEAAHAQTSALVGRREELDHLRNAIAEHAFVTIVGPGGIGKSSLAREFCRRWTGFSCWVDLAGVTGKSAVIATIREALAIEDHVPVESWIPRDRRSLLVLDNLEQIAHDILWLPDWLAQVAPGNVLTTSRIRLALKDEWVFPLASMCRADALAFLEDRVRKLGVNTLSESAKEQLIDRLGGWPLAIEIASGQSRVLTSADLLTQVERMTDWKGPWRDMPIRHETIRGTLDSSWSTTGSREQQTLQALSIFRATFLPSEAEDADPHSPQTLPELIEAGWIQRTEHAYAMHPLVAQYVQETEGAATAREQSADRVLTAAEAAFRQPLVHAHAIRWFRRILELSSVHPKHPRLPALLISEPIRMLLHQWDRFSDWYTAIERSTANAGDRVVAAAAGGYVAAFLHPDEAEHLLQRTQPAALASISDAVQQADIAAIVVGGYGRLGRIHLRSIPDLAAWEHEIQERERSVPGLAGVLAPYRATQFQQAVDRVDLPECERILSSMQLQEGGAYHQLLVASFQTTVAALHGNKADFVRLSERALGLVLRSQRPALVYEHARWQVFHAVLLDEISLLHTARECLARTDPLPVFDQWMACDLAIADAWFLEPGDAELRDPDVILTHLPPLLRLHLRWAQAMRIRHSDPRQAASALWAVESSFGTADQLYRALAISARAQILQAKGEDSSAERERALQLVASLPADHPIRKHV